jgi:hypothetical protein
MAETFGMRPSNKQRSRNKSGGNNNHNQRRNVGNIINRVFESAGPDGKVRGTPQQIIDKYLILARDAQLSNDRVAAENFQQHAEHYTRMLGEAMREMAAEQDQRRDSPQNGNQNGNAYGQNQGYRDRPPREEQQPEGLSGQRTVHVIDLAEDGDDSNLVETPEARGRAETPRTDYADRAPQTDRPDRPDRRNDRPRFAQGERREDRRPAPQTDPAPQPPEAVAVPLSPMMPSFVTLPEDAAGEAKPAAARRPRTPRKPKAPGGSSDGGPAEAAE